MERQLRKALDFPVAVFNFGIPAAGPVTELLTLKRLLREGLRPDLLLIEVLPPQLAGQAPVAGGELAWLPVSRLKLVDLALLERYGTNGGLRQAWWEAWPFPWYSQREALLSHVAPGWLPAHQRQDWFFSIDDSGWVNHPIDGLTAQRYRQGVAQARQTYQGPLAGFRLGGPSATALPELLDLCRRRGIPSVIVLMPEGSEFRGWYTANAWAQIDGYLSGLARRHEVPVVNARDWIGDEHFSDSHHLLPTGAALFTQRLGRTTVLPLLRASSQHCMGQGGGRR
jgi:hypothetical protein